MYTSIKSVPVVNLGKTQQDPCDIGIDGRLIIVHKFLGLFGKLVWVILFECFLYMYEWKSM